MDEIVSIVEALRRWVDEKPGRGAILEEDRAPPAHALAQGWLPDEVLRRWARPRPGLAIHPDHQAALPASYLALIERYGSLHWVAPPDYDGELAHEVRNSGPTAFLALLWPGHFEPWDFLDVMDAALVARLEAAGLAQFTVFHDGYTSGAAFDGRIRTPDGDYLVVEGFDDVTWIDRVLHPQPSAARWTFDAWLRDRIAQITAELG